MSVFEIIQQRRTIRKYKDEPVDEKIIEKILEAGRLSHSAQNSQDWKFIAVTEKDLIEELGEATEQGFCKKAAFLIVGCGLSSGRKMYCGQERATVDLSIGTQNMQLVAWEEGVGSCWIGHFDAERTREILKIPEEMCAITITTFGYPAEDPKARPRKDFEQVCSYNQY